MAKSKPAETTAIANWDEELAKAAQEAADQEAKTGVGQFFGLRAGLLTLNDAQLPNNELGCIILDSVLENVYYEAEFDDDSPASPVCFAFGRGDEDAMVPHEAVEAKQADSCATCPHAKWGSADRGRGKACRNRRRLALLPAGAFTNGLFEPIGDAEHYEKAAVAFLGVPPTSLKGFAAYVKNLAAALKRPPHGVYTRIKVVPDQKTQFKLTFENLGLVPNELMGEVMARAKVQRELTIFPYQKREAPPEPPPKAQGRQARAGRQATKY